MGEMRTTVFSLHSANEFITMKSEVNTQGVCNTTKRMSSDVVSEYKKLLSITTLAFNSTSKEI